MKRYSKKLPKFTADKIAEKETEYVIYKKALALSKCLFVLPFHPLSGWIFLTHKLNRSYNKAYGQHGHRQCNICVVNK